MDLEHLITNLFELIAAISASYYWIRTRDKAVKPFVWLLWLTVIVETLGLYGFIMQNNYDNEYFIKLKNSVFCENRWLYNIYTFVMLILLGYFYVNHLSKKKPKIIVVAIVCASSIFSISYYIVTDGFFLKSIPYDFAIQTLAIFIFVMFYLNELLRSDKILDFYKSYVFYISIAVLLWHLCLMPLFIFDAYFYAINTEFVQFRSQYLLISNILLYSCLTFSFLFSLFHKGKLVTKK